MAALNPWDCSGDKNCACRFHAKPVCLLSDDGQLLKKTCCAVMMVRYLHHLGASPGSPWRWWVQAFPDPATGGKALREFLNWETFEKPVSQLQRFGNVGMGGAGSGDGESSSGFLVFFKHVDEGTVELAKSKFGRPKELAFVGNKNVSVLLKNVMTRLLL